MAAPHRGDGIDQGLGVVVLQAQAINSCAKRTAQMNRPLLAGEEQHHSPPGLEFLDMWQTGTFVAAEPVVEENNVRRRFSEVEVRYVLVTANATDNLGVGEDQSAHCGTGRPTVVDDNDVNRRRAHDHPRIESPTTDRWLSGVRPMTPTIVVAKVPWVMRQSKPANAPLRRMSAWLAGPGTIETCQVGSAVVGAAT